MSIYTKTDRFFSNHWVEILIYDHIACSIYIACISPWHGHYLLPTYTRIESTYLLHKTWSNNPSLENMGCSCLKQINKTRSQFIDSAIRTKIIAKRTSADSNFEPINRLGNGPLEELLQMSPNNRYVFQCESCMNRWINVIWWHKISG